MGWTGDISKIGKLAENIGELANVPSRAASEVSDEIRGLIAKEFSNESDPYGEPWAAHEDATVERWGEHKVLDLSGDMRRSVEVKPMRGAGVSVTIDHPAGVHQTGWDDVPARPVLPAEEMPEDWEEAIDAACETEFRKAVGQ